MSEGAAGREPPDREASGTRPGPPATELSGDAWAPSSSSGKRRLVRIALATLLLLFIAWLVDLPQAFELFAEARWRWIFLGVVVVQVQVVLSAIRWQRTAVRLGQSLSVPQAVREYFLATLGNLSLPGGVTGDAARVYRNRQSAGTAVSVRSVVIERLAGQLALLLLTLVGWLAWPYLMGSATPETGNRLLQIAFGMLLLLVLAYVLMQRFAGTKVSTFVDDFGATLHQVWVADRQWLLQGGLSLAVVATYLAVFACSAVALHQALPLAGVISVVPLVLLSMIIPLSIGGWGIREAVAVSLWPLMGLSVEAAVATSILYGLISTIACLPGALWAMMYSQGTAAR